MLEDGGGHILQLRGPEEIARQICWIEPSYRRLPLDLSRPKWSQELRSPKSAEPDPDMMDLFSEILTLPPPDGTDVAVALDWYKVPQPGIDSYHWPNTAAGELVHDAKYRYRAEPLFQTDIGRMLAGALVVVVQGHYLLRRADCVISVPGHDAARASFGEGLAATVAEALALPLAQARSSIEFRPQAKNMPTHERADMLREKFSISANLSGQRVLIVDDVFTTGATVAETARAARGAGARRVMSACVVRTLRG